MAKRGRAAPQGEQDPLTLVVGVGYVGRRVLKSGSQGSVLGLSRRVDPTLPTVEAFDLDGDSALPLTLPADYRVLYTVPPAAQTETDNRLERLLARLEPAPAVFVYISTTGVYGDRGGERVDESAVVQPTSARARRRVAAEQLLQSWSKTEGVRLCILRAPGIYGPDRLGVERIRAGEPVIRERDANPGNRIHVDDLVACCEAALANAGAAGIFNVGDGDYRTSSWFALEVARQAGLPAPPGISREEAERTYSRQRLSFLADSRRIDTQRMQTVLGVTPRFSNAEDGIRASLQS